MPKEKSRVISEMITTEKTYSKGLEWLVKWKKELQENKLIKEEEITNIFSSCIENIKQISDMFYTDICKRHKNWSKESEIGDVYQNFAPYFRVYVDYCNNNENSGKTLTQLLKTKKKFKEYVNIQEKAAGDRIESMLILPIQRIPRYEMLLKRALELTKKDHSDYPKLKKAFEMVHDICQKNNSSMAIYTGQRRKIELQEMFGDKVHLMKPHRNLIEEFTDLEMVDVATDQPKDCTLILFSDCIIIVLNLKSIGRSTFYGYTEFHENSFIYAKDDLKYYRNLFKIVGKTKWFILTAKSKVTRDKVVSICGEYIFSIRKEIKKRKSLLKTSKKLSTHVDMEIVWAERQGEKLVYVLEATKSILSNVNNEHERK